MNDIINIEWIYEDAKAKYGICFLAYEGWCLCEYHGKLFGFIMHFEVKFDHEHAARHALAEVAGEQGWRKI